MLLFNLGHYNNLQLFSELPLCLELQLRFSSWRKDELIIIYVGSRSHDVYIFQRPLTSLQYPACDVVVYAAQNMCASARMTPAATASCSRIGSRAYVTQMKNMVAHTGLSATLRLNSNVKNVAIITYDTPIRYSSLSAGLASTATKPVIVKERKTNQ